ncbi:MAG: ArsR/SmtB family transcription factor [Endomicrobiales bacterium]
MLFDFEKNSGLLKALGHPVRLRIVLGLLENEECNVNKIVENLGIPQSTASQHLGVLRSRGIIVPRKEGVKTCYRVVDERVKEIIAVLKK